MLRPRRDNGILCDGLDLDCSTRLSRDNHDSILWRRKEVNVTLFSGLNHIFVFSCAEERRENKERSFWMLDHLGIIKNVSLFKCLEQIQSKLNLQDDYSDPIIKDYF